MAHDDAGQEKRRPFAAAPRQREAGGSSGLRLSCPDDAGLEGRSLGDPAPRRARAPVRLSAIQLPAAGIEAFGVLTLIPTPAPAQRAQEPRYM